MCTIFVKVYFFLKAMEISILVKFKTYLKERLIFLTLSRYQDLIKDLYKHLLIVLQNIPKHFTKYTLNTYKLVKYILTGMQQFDSNFLGFILFYFTLYY